MAYIIFGAVIAIAAVAFALTRRKSRAPSNSGGGSAWRPRPTDKQ